MTYYLNVQQTVTLPQNYLYVIPPGPQYQQSETKICCITRLQMLRLNMQDSIHVKEETTTRIMTHQNTDWY